MAVTDEKTCPNCAAPVADHGETGCVLNALIGVLRDRGDTSPDKLLELHAKANVDRLWDDLGPIVDRLGEGFYNEG